MRFEKDVLCQVCRRLPIACRSKAPARDALVMPPEQLVDEVIAITACPFFRLGEQFFVGDPAQVHPDDYSDGSWVSLSGLCSKTAGAAPAEQQGHPSGQNACGTIPRVKALAVGCVMTIVAALVPPTTLLAQRSRVQNDVQHALDEGARLQRAGDAAGARESYLLALQSSPPKSLERGRSLLTLAGVEAALGRYAESSRHAAEATALFEALGNDAGVAASLNRGGVTALNAGDYGEAERLLTSALARSTRIGNNEARAEQLGNLGNVQFYLGRYADAARRYEEALAVTSASSGEAWAPRRRRIFLLNQASLFQRLGRDQQALAVYAELGALSGELRPREQGEMLVNLGVLYRHLGDPIKALHAYDEARNLFSRERAVDGEIGALNNRGIVLALDLGRIDEAEQSFSAALDMATTAGNRRGMLLARLYRGETRLRGGRPDLAREDFDRGLALARDLHTPEEEWKALYGLGRVESRAEHAIHYLNEAVQTIEAVREAIRLPSLRSDFLADKRVVYDALIHARLETAPTEALFDLLERSHSRVWRERLGLGKAIDLSSVQRALPERMLLLDYWHSPQGAAVIAVSRTRAAVIPVGLDERQITALIDAMAAGPSSHWRDLAREIGPRVLPPPDWFDAIDRVAIVPDGALALVPFEVLPVAGRLLVERVAVSYTPTAATLLRAPPRTRGWVLPWKLQLRVFADPVFTSAELDNAPPVQGRLEASADEARQVASELAGHTAMHLGQDSRKAYLLATTEQSPILHIATHAVADASAMEQSRILFSPASGSGAIADYLFLKEAYGLPLGGVELAVLSACDTERGRAVNGEGVQSFSRAFLASGVRSTVTTMWRVADRPTANFMQVFYHHLQRGVPRDEALRRTKLRFLESGSDLADPHFWAAFVLTGDGLRPIPRAISWKAIAAAAAGLLALAFLLVGLYRSRLRTRSMSAA